MSFTSQLTSIHTKAKDLYHILNEEFDSLSSQDFEKFKAIQPKKVQLLKSLKEFDALKDTYLADNNIPQDSPVELASSLTESEKIEWESFLNVLNDCGLLHRKIDIYLNQKIQTTNALLELLQVNKAHNATKLYDAFGKSNLSTISKTITEA